MAAGVEVGVEDLGLVAPTAEHFPPGLPSILVEYAEEYKQEDSLEGVEEDKEDLSRRA